jgi:hypothetical protein
MAQLTTNPARAIEEPAIYNDAPAAPCSWDHPKNDFRIRSSAVGGFRQSKAVGIVCETDGGRGKRGH